MQRLSRNKAHAETKLIVEIRKDLGMHELDLSMILKYLELGPLNCEYVKSPIPNMDCENNHVGNESESCKNRDKRGYKEQTVKIKRSVEMHTFI